MCAPLPSLLALLRQLTSHIRNKQRRSEVYGKLKHKKKARERWRGSQPIPVSLLLTPLSTPFIRLPSTSPLNSLISAPRPLAQVAKKKERLKRERDDERARELGEEPAPRPPQRTIESTREADPTAVEAGDSEVAADEACDEFAAHFAGDREPNVMLTTSRRPTKIMYDLVKDMLAIVPKGAFYERREYEIKDICKYASARGFSDVAVFHEDAKEVNGLLLVHLPDGPTAHFRLSSLVLAKDIKGHGRATGHKPELILNNFTTRLGHRVGRMFASLFCQDPTFRGRRAITFHNQRDFIFFRHHRYIFESKEVALPAEKGAAKKKKKPKSEERVIARLQECGPRFTLRLLVRACEGKKRE